MIPFFYFFAQLDGSSIPLPLVAAICLVAGAGLVWLANWTKAVRENDDRFERKSDPPIHKEYATKSEVEAVDNKVEGLRTEMQLEFRENRRLSGDSRQKLYKKIEESNKELGIKIEDNGKLAASQQTAIDGLTKSVDTFSSDIKNLISLMGQIKGKDNQS